MRQKDRQTDKGRVGRRKTEGGKKRNGGEKFALDEIGARVRTHVYS